MWTPMAIIVITLILIIVGVFVYLTHRVEFSGDGRLTDYGIWTYPRYSISLPLTDIGRGTTYTYTISGVPSVHWTLLLRLHNHQSGLVQLRECADHILSIRLCDGGRNEIISVSARVSDWTVSQSRDNIELWHPSFRMRPLRQDERYSIEMTLLGVAKDSPRLVIEPRIVGGGNESP